MMDKILKLYKKYKEIINYLFFGVLDCLCEYHPFRLLQRGGEGGAGLGDRPSPGGGDH